LVSVICFISKWYSILDLFFYWVITVHSWSHIQGFNWWLEIDKWKYYQYKI
jgi:hypothetical protein